MVHRKKIWEWKNGKSIPRIKTIEKIKDKELRENVALWAIKKYLPYVSKKRILEELL